MSSAASEFAAANALRDSATFPSFWSRIFGRTTLYDAALKFDAIGYKYDSVQAYTAAAECYLQYGDIKCAVRACSECIYKSI
jgi:hypothetical protein